MENTPDLRKNGPAPLRASDADRDRYAHILREALAEGRLTPEEHADRIDVVYSSRTVAELAPLVRDLPEGQPTAPAPRVRAPGTIAVFGPDGFRDNDSEAPDLVAVFSSAGRKGRWRVGHRLKGVAVFGEITIDMTEAVFTEPVVYVKAVSVFGQVTVLLPPGVNVRSGGTGVFGTFQANDQYVADPTATTVVITGSAVFGSVDGRIRRRRTSLGQ